MSDWQPVRIATSEMITAAHNGKLGINPEGSIRDQLKIVRVRAFPLSDWFLSKIRSKNCSSREFYELHPDDRPLLCDKRIGGIMVLCEHQILAD